MSSNPEGGLLIGVTETEEQRLQEVERQRVEKEKRDEAMRRQNEELEESTRVMRAERSEANRRWLEEARAREAKRRANISAKGLTSGTPNAGKAAEDAQRIRDAIEHGSDFLSTDQEVRIREAAEGLLAAPEALLYSADCRAKQLCQENPSVEIALIVATIEEIVQSLIRELTQERRRNEAAMSGGEPVKGLSQRYIGRHEH